MDSSVVGLLQLRVEACGRAKYVSLSGSMQNGQIVCNKVKHFVIEVRV